jgi:hypothetical protein
MKISSDGCGGVQLREEGAQDFTEARQRLFLTKFAGTANVKDSAREAGVAVSTITGRRRSDPRFRAAFDEAQAEAVVILRAELVRRGLELLQCTGANDRSVTTLQGMDAKFLLQLIDKHERSMSHPLGDIKPQRSDAAQAAARLHALMTRMRAERKRELEKKRKQRGQ